MVLEKTLESPLDCKEIQSVHSKGDQPWDFFGRNDAKAETPAPQALNLLCVPDTIPTGLAEAKPGWWLESEGSVPGMLSVGLG